MQHDKAFTRWARIKAQQEGGGGGGGGGGKRGVGDCGMEKRVVDAAAAIKPSSSVLKYDPSSAMLGETCGPGRAWVGSGE